MKKKKKVSIQAIPNKIFQVKFIRKLNFNLLKLEAVMTQLFSRHSSTPLKLKSILVFIMMKVVRRIELIKVW